MRAVEPKLSKYLHHAAAKRGVPLSGTFESLVDSNTAEYMGQYQIYHELLQQSTLWGYVETFRYFAIATIAVIPLVLLIKGIKRTKAE